MLKLESVRYKGLLDPTLKREPMHPEQSRVYAMLVMTEISEDREGNTDRVVMARRRRMAAIESTFGGKVLLKRLAAHGLDVSRIATSGVLVVALMHTNSPAKAVVWAYTLALMAAMEGEPITMRLLSQHFPMGFVTEGDWVNAWDAQKGWMLFADQPERKGIDNYLDTSEPWDALREFVGVEVKECPQQS